MIKRIEPRIIHFRAETFIVIISPFPEPPIDVSDTDACSAAI